MPTVSAVKPQYGPTLVQILASRPLPVRIVAAVAATLLFAAVVVVALTTRADETEVLIRKPTTFNFVYGPQFKRVSEPSSIIALRNVRDGLFLDSYVIRDLQLPPYRGAVGGMLPLYSNGYLAKLRARYPGFRFVGEARARINNGIGYQLTFTSKLGKRTLYGRHLLLVEDLPDGHRRGVIIELESTPAAGTPNALAIGTAGALKAPLRSFRFGADREGGTS
jgi:hypothetical protein